jgi:predicted polyphosphate/ATP-dependent NAD kinase
MNIKKWAFIYTLDDPAAEARVDALGSLVCVGISDVSDAPAVARRLVADGVELIELCGGFGGAGLGAVVAAVQNRVPVGAVFFGVEASAGLTQLGSRAEGGAGQAAPQAQR